MGRTIPLFTEKSFKLNIFRNLLITFLFIACPLNAQKLGGAAENALVARSIQVNAGWNLLSLPVKLEGSSSESVFPTAISPAFIFQNHYLIQDTLQNGLGFWIKFNAPETILIIGESISQDTITLQGGWNMIGSLSTPTAVQDILISPLGNVRSDYYWYDGSYRIADTLQPGFGYWVKANQNGELIIYSSTETILSIISPLDNSVGQPVNISLRWSCTNIKSGPLTYDVYFGEDDPPAMKVSSNQTDTSLDRNGLIPGRSYYWQVVYKDIYGDSTSGPVWKFTTNNPPDIVSNISPPDNSLGQSVDLVLRWSCSDNEGDPLTYDLFFGEDNPPATKVLSDQPDTALSRDGLSRGTAYYWKVITRDIHGDSTSGPVWKFTTNNPPGIVSNISPLDGSVGQPVDIALRWTCGDIEGDPLTYDLYFGEDNPPATKVLSDQPDTVLNRYGLNRGTSYYWRVTSRDIHVDTTTGPVWKFTTNNPPGIASIISPVDSSIGQPVNIVLRWSCSDIEGDPLTYDLYFGEDNPPATKVSSDQLDTSYSINDLLSGTSYYWQVVSRDIHGDSAQSLVWTFMTMGAACPGIATVDYDGKTYNTVQIGSQCWLKENLNTGTMVDSLIEQTNNSVVEKYCYKNDTANCTSFGGLYQWNEAMAYSNVPGSQGICPAGWHIPTHDEVFYLRTVVDSNSNALKAIGQGAGAGAGTNTTGFSALLGGYRYPDGYFYDLGAYTAFWGSTEYDPAILVTRLELESDNSNLNTIESLKDYGFPVRCIKD